VTSLFICGRVFSNNCPTANSLLPYENEVEHTQPGLDSIVGIIFEFSKRKTLRC